MTSDGGVAPRFRHSASARGSPARLLVRADLLRMT